MIVHDFNVFSPGIRPAEAETKLIVNADAMLPSTVPFQDFQSIPRWDPQIVEPARNFQLSQLASRHARDFRESPNRRSFSKRLRIDTLECLDHACQ